MQRIPVTSTNILEVGYSDEHGVMELMFSTGTVYQYFDVPRHVYDELIQAESIGRYVNSSIKGQYRYARV